MKDSELDELLRGADPGVAPPAGFRRAVWRRIGSSSMRGSRCFAWAGRLTRVLTRPLGAGATITALAMLGLWLGSASQPEVGAAKAAYVESVSPFAAAQGK